MTIHENLSPTPTGWFSRFPFGLPGPFDTLRTETPLKSFLTLQTRLEQLHLREAQVRLDPSTPLGGHFLGAGIPVFAGFKGKPKGTLPATFFGPALKHQTGGENGGRRRAPNSNIPRDEAPRLSRPMPILVLLLCREGVASIKEQHMAVAQKTGTKMAPW